MHMCSVEEEGDPELLQVSAQLLLLQFVSLAVICLSVLAGLPVYLSGEWCC